MLFRYREVNPEDRGVRFESGSPWRMELRNTREESRGPLIVREALFRTIVYTVCRALSRPHCNKLLRTEWLKATQIYYLTIPEVRSPKWGSLG